MFKSAEMLISLFYAIIKPRSVYPSRDNIITYLIIVIYCFLINKYCYKRLIKKLHSFFF